MRKDRLLAFSDGVFAVVITIMVLELKVPHEADLGALLPLVPALLSYVLSFVYVAIYWNNHHHMMELVKRVNGACLWANMVLLFFLSLVPFATSWMGETHFALWPTVVYGALLLLSGFGYALLEKALVRAHADNARLKQAIGGEFKGNVSLALYAVGIAATFYMPWISLTLYAVVALMWLVPDPRVERLIKQGE